MPRAKASSDVVKPKRTISSRSPRAVSAARTTGSTTRRKAPTTITAQPKNYSSLKSVAITLGVFAVILGGSAFVGMADSGQINVTGVIQERGQTLRDEGRVDEANQLSIPKNDGVRRPNGGLRPSNNDGASTAPAPATLGAEDSVASSSVETSVDSETEEQEETPVVESPTDSETPKTEPDTAGVAI